MECLSGVVWITAYNELSDYMLKAGEVLIIPNNGLTLIEAIGDCRVRIDFPNCSSTYCIVCWFCAAGIAWCWG